MHNLRNSYLTLTSPLVPLQGTVTYPAPAKKDEEEEEKPGDKFEGSLVHGQREGKGKYTWSNGCCYAGEYKNNVRHRQGSLTMPDNSKYEGWCRHQCSHKPTLTNLPSSCMVALLAILHPNLHAIGGWSENKMHGEGSYTYANGDMYTGSFQQGVKHGNGSYYFKVGSNSMSWVPSLVTIHVFS